MKRLYCEALEPRASEDARIANHYVKAGRYQSDQEAAVEARHVMAELFTMKMINTSNAHLLVWNTAEAPAYE